MALQASTSVLTATFTAVTGPLVTINPVVFLQVVKQPIDLSRTGTNGIDQNYFGADAGRPQTVTSPKAPIDLTPMFTEVYSP